jgi:phosphotransferase system HPr-like phosphotransfer protein
VSISWGTSWGNSWGNSWGGGSTPPTPDVPTSAGGRRSSATQYRAKTISRELREKEREAKRQARELHRLAMVQLRAEGVTRDIGVKQTRALLDLAIEEEQPISIETPALSGPEMQQALDAIMAWIRARAFERMRDEDEADAELLLLAVL